MPAEKKPKQRQIRATVRGVIAALFGVQSDANRQKDFTEGSPLLFIVLGVLIIALLVLALVGLSQLAAA